MRRLYNEAQKEIDERKRAEAELQKAKEELEHRVQVRTASLQETTEQLEAFCYTIAHDLRSPLRAQQSYAQILLDEYNDVLDETGREYAHRIIGSASRLDALVNDLLAYSRISRTALEFNEVDLNNVVKEVLENLSDEIRHREANVSVDPLARVTAYEPTVNLVITNLLSNSLKFVKPDARPEIRVWNEPCEGFVRLWVEDNGIGISLDQHSRIFGVFERLHSMRRYPGTGIGLAIVQKGVERMGGRVGVESESDMGSRFWIELPESK